MSATFPTSPVETRDLRSPGQPFKHEKDYKAKWSNGKRPSAGVRIRWTPEDSQALVGGSESQRAKVRPEKQSIYANYESKSHANRTPRPSGNSHSYDLGRSSGRVEKRGDAHFEAVDAPLSRSLLELLPQHVNNQTPAITTAFYHDDLDSIYASTERGHTVGLEGLVERAEKKWVSEQTEKIVRGEYEVLDGEGETTVLKKGKRSPKQKAIKNQPAATKVVEEDDGFELI